jgi:hypothetical protein
MIVEHRTYTLHPGKLEAFLAIYRKQGLPLQERHLEGLLGYFMVEIGPLNQVVHLWSYEDMADRDRRRTALAADPKWSLYLEQALPLIQMQESKILRPTDFSPLK